jgi:methionyl-tRNA formyltransferase
MLFIAGQKAFGETVYRMVKARGDEIAGVCAPVLNSSGKYRDRLRAAAEDDGVLWLPSGSLKANTLPEDVDLIICAHSHDFISRKTRLRAKLGAIGYHPSLLPLHRGRDAIRWAIHAGDKVTGGSVYWLTDNVDAGPIAAQSHVFIQPGDTPEELWRRDLFPLGVRLFVRVLSDLSEGRIVRIPQAKGCATWEPSFTRPPIYRPDLLMLGGAIEGYKTITEVKYSNVE